MGTPLGTAMENDDTGKVIAYSLAVGIPYGNKVLSLEEDHDPVHGCGLSQWRPHHSSHYQEP